MLIFMYFLISWLDLDLVISWCLWIVVVLHPLCIQVSYLLDFCIASGCQIVVFMTPNS